MPESIRESAQPKKARQGGRLHAFAPAGGIPAIRLRVIRSHGMPCSDLLPVPAGGIGMGAALAQSGTPVSSAQRRAADLCRIAWRAVPCGWHLYNTGQALACSLNGERVNGEWPWPVMIGDVLEFGVLRLVVEADGSAVVALPQLQ